MNCRELPGQGIARVPATPGRRWGLGVLAGSGQGRVVRAAVPGRRDPMETAVTRSCQTAVG
jgi:hypothetical protein